MEATPLELLVDPLFTLKKNGGGPHHLALRPWEMEAGSGIESRAASGTAWSGLQGVR